tara:strand:+ start:18188 stop:19834 length:1647 start_codon:yes stop_codon:yes gene_type:complete
LLITACGADDKDEPITGEANISILHYDYQFNMESREARAELRVRIDSAGDCFTLPMRSEGLREVTLDEDVALTSNVQGGQAQVCGIGWPEGTEVLFASTTTVPLDTWQGSQVGYSVSPDIEGNPFTYLVSWVGGCDRFAPCDAKASSFATYRFTIDHPAGQQVLCPGTLSPGETQTICEFDYAGGPTYSSFGFAASESWVKSDLGDWGGVDVSFYDMPTADIARKIDVEEHKSFMAWMVENFGPYPYGNELRFAVGPTYWNGFEHPGNIVLNDRLRTSGFQSAFTNPLAHTTSHEIAHQWAGDETTLLTTHDFVWKEAMAEYLVFVHKVENLSESRARQTLAAWKSFAGSSEYYLVPGEKPELIDYYGDVYGPGPMILFRQLEALYSRDAVMEALGSLLGEQRAIGIDDVQLALEAATGADLNGYFATWVHGEGAPQWPRFTVAMTEEGADLRVVVEQDNPEAGLFGCAFDIALRGENEEELLVRVDLGPDGSARFEEVVTPEFVVANTLFDANRECLAFESTAGSNATSNTSAKPKRVNPWVAEAFR